MHKNISASRFSLFFLVFLSTIVSAGFIFAQGEEPPQQRVYQVMDIRVKTGMGPAFENFMKSEIVPAVKKTKEPSMLVLRTDQFGQAGSYTIFTPMQSLSELDRPGPLVQAIGEEGVAAMLAKLQLLIYEPKIYMVTGRPDLGISPPNGYDMKLALALSVSVAPGRTADYEKYLKDMMTILGKTNTKGILAGRVSLGGNPNEYLLYSLFDTFADLDAFGPAFGRAVAEAQILFPVDIVTHQEMTVKRFLPELSIMPPSPKAKQ